MKWHAIKGGLYRTLRVVLLVYLGILILLAFIQRQLIYLRSQAAEPELIAHAERAGLEPWRDGEGEIIGWKGAESEPKAPNRMLLFHGNAGYAVLRQHYVRGFGPDWEVYVFEYPGYGARSGEPSEETINAAAEAAFQQLRGDDDRPIFLTGESLGSGPACALAAKHPDQVSGVMLVTPFANLPDVAARHYPFLPVRALMQDRFDNVSALSKYQGPVAFLLAGSDEVVPTEMGRELYESYQGPKHLRVEEGAGHNSIDLSPSAVWWQEDSEFLRAP